MIICLGYNTISKCADFARKCAKTEMPMEFGDQNGRVRSLKEIELDSFVGKLGEAAVNKYFGLQGIKTALDMNVYPSGQWDDCDLKYKGWRFDVKCTRRTPAFFLIEWRKLQYRADTKELPHFFVVTRLKTAIPSLEELPHDAEVDLVGFIDIRTLQTGNSSLRIIDEGEKIPGTPVKGRSKSFYMTEAEIPHSWKALIKKLRKSKPFDFNGYKVPGRELCEEEKSPEVVETASATLPKYTLLLSGRESSLTTDDINHLISNGIKLLIFGTDSTLRIYRKIAEKSPHFCQCYAVPESFRIPDLRIIDGNANGAQLSELERLAEAAQSFNLEQYKVEHAPTTGTLIVKASAGTGKTTVLVDRIIYLFATCEKLQPCDLCMLTFTNKAAFHMRQKLSERLYELYEQTKNSDRNIRWLRILEALGDLQLSTIDSFFKDLLSAEGSVLGYGTNVSIRNMSVQKEKILKDILEEFITNSVKKDVIDINVITSNELIALATKILEKLHGYGYSCDQIIKADFGDCDDPEESRINYIIESLVKKGEILYQDIKRKNNAYSLDDLKLEVAKIAELSTELPHLKGFRYIFVDEFQDTDNSQIRSLVWLQRALNCQLCVVGDIKQSIYRFRGAEESAFTELSRLTKTHQQYFELHKNYRTEETLFSNLDKIFSAMAKGPKKLLAWDRDSQSVISGNGNLKRVKLSNNADLDSEEYKTCVIDTLKELLSLSVRRMRAESKQGNRDAEQICILTRENWQASKVARWCRDANINCIAKIDKSFYQSAPVLDLLNLLGAALYPSDTRRLWNCLQSSYSMKKGRLSEILAFDGKESEICEYCQRLLKGSPWEILLNNAKWSPFFPLLESLICDSNPAAVYVATQCKNSNVQDLKKEREYIEYNLNLDKLITILFRKFSGETASLIDVFDFLNNMVSTNKEEDFLEAEIADLSDSPTVVAMTVHKAKGLEFDSVLIPFAGFEFLKEPKKYSVICDASKDNTAEPMVLKVGWYVDGYKREYCNKNYLPLKKIENDRQRRDEARLLYVAATRAKHDLRIIVPKETVINSWSEFLPEEF